MPLNYKNDFRIKDMRRHVSYPPYAELSEKEKFSSIDRLKRIEEAHIMMSSGLDRIPHGGRPIGQTVAGYLLELKATDAPLDDWVFVESRQGDTACDLLVYAKARDEYWKWHDEAAQDYRYNDNLEAPEVGTAEPDGDGLEVLDEMIRNIGGAIASAEAQGFVSNLAGQQGSNPVE